MHPIVGKLPSCFRVCAAGDEQRYTAISKPRPRIAAPIGEGIISLEVKLPISEVIHAPLVFERLVSAAVAKTSLRSPTRI